MISSLDLIDGRGAGFPRPPGAEIFGPFFPPQNILQWLLVALYFWRTCRLIATYKALYMHGVRVGLMPYMSRLICHTLLLRAGVAAAPSTAAQNHPVRERDAAREPHRRHAGNTSEKAHILKSLFDSGVYIANVLGH